MSASTGTWFIVSLHPSLLRRRRSLRRQKAGYRLNLGALIEAILYLHARAKNESSLSDQP